MATFKVGDRVRVVADIYGFGQPTLGKEGVIVRVSATEANHWVVDIPGAVGVPTIFLGPTEWDCHPSELAPLTPPAQDEWAADQVRKVTKPVYTEPERVKERA